MLAHGVRDDHMCTRCLVRGDLRSWFSWVLQRRFPDFAHIAKVVLGFTKHHLTFCAYVRIASSCTEPYDSKYIDFFFLIVDSNIFNTTTLAFSSLSPAPLPLQTPQVSSTWRKSLRQNTILASATAPTLHEALPSPTCPFRTMPCANTPSPAAMPEGTKQEK